MGSVVRDWMLSVSLRMEIFVQSGIDVLWSGKVFARFGDNGSTNQPKKFRWGLKPRSYSSQGRIRADRVFVRTEGVVSMSTLRFITVGETVYSASRVFVGSNLRTFQGDAYGRLLRRLQRSGWCLRAVTVVELSVYRVGRSFVSLWSFWTALLTIQAMELGGCPTLSEDVGCDGERIRSVILLVM